MAVDPADWMTLFETLELTHLPYADVLQLADEGVLTTRRSGAVVLYAAEDVIRLAASGQALAGPSAPPQDKTSPRGERRSPDRVVSRGELVVRRRR